MSKLPFILFHPSDWLRDTGGLSPLAKAAWIDILCYAWNEPERGVFTRSREAFCSLLRIPAADFVSVISELATVASVTASNEKVTVMSRRMMALEKRYKQNAIRQARFRSNAQSNAPVTHKTLEERKEKEKEVRKDVAEKNEENEKEKNPLPAGPAPAHPKGLSLGPPSTPTPQKPKGAFKPVTPGHDSNCTCEFCFVKVVKAWDF